MPTYEVKSPDGKVWDITAPEGATSDEVLVYAKTQWAAQQKDLPPPLAVQAGRGLMEIPRQVGLTARYGIEGLANMVQPFTEPIRVGVVNPLLRAMQPRTLSDLVTDSKPATAAPTGKLGVNIANLLGLPSPETPNERVVGDMTRMVAGAGGMSAGAGKLAGMAPEGAKQVLSLLAANPGTQAISAAGAGGAGGAVREAGGGPGMEFAASLLGGLAAPLGAQGLSSVGAKLSNAVKASQGGTAQVDAVLKLELGKAGVNWDEIGAAAKLQLRKDAQAAIYSGQPLNPQALARLADYRRIDAVPQLGDITQDPRILTQQRNLSKQMANQRGSLLGADLPNIDNANATKVISALEGSTNSPLDAFATGQRIIGGVLGKDAALNSNVNSLYANAKDSAGRSLPLDGAAFTRDANEALRKNLSPKLSAEVDAILNDIATGKTPLTVEYAEQIKTALGRKARAAQATEGDLAYAYGLVRKALDNAPLQSSRQVNPRNLPAIPETVPPSDVFAGSAAVDAFNQARGAAAGRFKWQESAKFIDDALGGAEPDKFVKKHIIGGDVADLQRMRDEFANSPETLAAVKKQMVGYIMERGKVDGDTVKFSSAGMNDALESLGRKLPIFFSAEEIQQIRSAVNVGRYMQSQPIGSAVNNSNSAALFLGKLSDALGSASVIPGLGPLVAGPLQTGALTLQARQMNNVGAGLLQPQGPRPNVINPALIYGGLLGLPAIPPSQ